ncbi:MAG: ABC transporter ATP-binding protein [Acidimicrobiales bacterium]
MKPQGELSVAAVTVNFDGLSVLDDVSLRASSGEVVGVIGPNGAGKTTLFNVVCGFVRHSAGRITWNDRELRHQHPQDLAALGISRTLQGVGLFPGLSALDNVMVGTASTAKAGLVASLCGFRRSSREERKLRAVALAALDRLGVAEHAANLPSALPYPVQKKVAIARALVSRPALILMDEPASGLSATDIEELSGLLASLREESGVLIVEHNMDLVMASCDRIVVLDFGRVVATGSPDEIRANPAVTTAYLGARLDGEQDHARS